VHLVHEQRRVQHEDRAEDYDQPLRAEVRDGEEEVDLRRLAEAADVQHDEDRQRDQRGDDVPGRMADRMQAG
jgi:hypothetical protein